MQVQCEGATLTFLWSSIPVCPTHSHDTAQQTVSVPKGAGFSGKVENSPHDLLGDVEEVVEAVGWIGNLYFSIG